MLGYTAAAQFCFPDTCSVGPFSVAGALVAYGVDKHGRFGLNERVRIKDLARGVTLLDVADGKFHPEDALTCGGDQPPAGIGPVRSIVLRGDGAVAWIAQRICDFHHITTYEVHTASRSRLDRLLDAATDIVPTSLRLSHGSVSWQVGTSRKTAQL